MYLSNVSGLIFCFYQIIFVLPQVPPQKQDGTEFTTELPINIDDVGGLPETESVLEENQLKGGKVLDVPSSQEEMEVTNFKCEMLEMCDKDDSFTKIIGILEMKVIKMEKKVAELLNKLESESTSNKMSLMNMENMLSKCQCNDATKSSTKEPEALFPLQQTKTSPVPQSSTTETPTAAPSGFYPLRTRGNNPRCLDGSGGAGPIIVKRCKNSTSSQQWQLVNGSFRNNETQLCLDGAGEVGAVAAPCVGGKYQQWRTLKDNTIVNVGSSFCLTTGAYWAVTAECDGQYWQQYDYWANIKQPTIFFVTYYF